MSSEPRRAEWHDTAIEITDPEEARKHLTVTDVCERTGIRQLTLYHAMNRSGAFSGRKPMHIIARPAYRYHSEPRWSEAQVSEYYDTVTERTRTFDQKYGHLPTVTLADAKADQLVSLRAIARTSGFALTTLHRWADDENFPAAIALVPSKGPVPRLLRTWPEVRAYLLGRRPDADLPNALPDSVFRNG